MSETVFLTFPTSLWLVLTGGANKLLMEVTDVKDCGLALLTFDKGVRWGEGNGSPLQYSCLENHMDRGAWWAAVHGVTKSRT